MSDEQLPINMNTPGDAGEPIAENYVANQLKIARATLRRTQIIGLISTFVVLAYMGYITVGLRAFLEPLSAAELANGLIAQRVQEQGPEYAQQASQQIPGLIAQIPDYAVQQMPVLRENLEKKFESTLTDNVNSSSAQVSKGLDQYLTDHKDEMHLALTSGANSPAISQMGEGITQTFMDTLKETPTDGGESVQTKIDKSLSSLTDIQKKMDRLANAKDLTPQEKKTRHLIAIMTKTINTQMPKGVQVSSATMP